MDNVLRDVLSRCLSVLHGAPWLSLKPGPIDPKKPSKQKLHWLNTNLGCVGHAISAEARLSKWAQCHKNDVVAIKAGTTWQLARILFHCSSNGICFSAVHLFERVSSPKDHASFSVWKVGQSNRMVELEDIMDSLIYSKSGEEVVALHPLELFGR